jgi:hypothetical protein
MILMILEQKYTTHETNLQLEQLLKSLHID